MRLRSPAWEDWELSNSNALTRDPEIHDTSDTADFGRFALSLLMDLDAAHPSKLDLVDHNDVSAGGASLHKFWYYLAHQGIISGEPSECALTPMGRKSLHAAFETQDEKGLASLSSSGLPSGTPASALLLDVMRHNFLLQAETH